MWHITQVSHIFYCAQRERAEKETEREKRSRERGGGEKQQQRGNIAHTCDSAQSWAMARDKASETDKDGVREGDGDRAEERAIH